MEDIQLIKIIVVGDANVGKTSLLTQYCWKQFDVNQSPTIGCDFSTKIIRRNKFQLKLQLWDIAGSPKIQGQEKFQTVSRLFIRGSLGCLIVSDITEEQSLLNTLTWKNIVEGNSEHMDQLPLFLIQNKIDLVEGIIYLKQLYLIGQPLKNFQTKESLDKFTAENGFTKAYQISVKKNEKLDQIFEDLVTEMLERKLLNLEDNPLKRFGTNQLNLLTVPFFCKIPIEHPAFLKKKEKKIHAVDNVT